MTDNNQIQDGNKLTLTVKIDKSGILWICSEDNIKCSELMRILSLIQLDLAKELSKQNTILVGSNHAK